MNTNIKIVQFAILLQLTQKTGYAFDQWEVEDILAKIVGMIPEQPAPNFTTYTNQYEVRDLLKYMSEGKD
jgi:hypothetical protein